MAYKRRHVQKNERASTFGLNITSMTDMFTILLVFLLQTYSTNDFQIELEKGMNLPLSNVEANPTKATQISLSKTELKVAGRTIASLNGSDFSKSDLEASDSNFIKPLFTELERLAKESKEPADLEGKLILQADSSLQYDLLRKVMYTASMAGFPKLKMATVVGN